jgi:transporter family-2 protein
MFAFALLAIINGFLISINRIINSKLGEFTTPLKSSFVNHFVGFLFLILLAPFLSGINFDNSFSQFPLHVFFGGILGVLFVFFNSLVIPKIGAMKTVLLVISGQLILSTLLDFQSGKLSFSLVPLIGISFIILGVKLSFEINHEKK